MSDYAPSAARFLVEMDGVTTMEATEMSGGKLTHEPVDLMVGTRDLPIPGRGKSKIDPVKLKHAKVLNNSGREIWQWFNDFFRGIAVDRRNIRVVALDEKNVAILTIDFIDCLPTEFEAVEYKADSKDADFFNASFQPSDLDIVL